MSKYSVNLKLKIVNEYLSGEYSYGYLKKKYNLCGDAQIKVWVNQFKQNGQEGLERKISKTNFTGDFKLRVIKYRQLHRLSYQETANHFKISQGSTIANWVRRYDEDGFEGLNRPIGRSRKMPENQKTINPNNLKESEREELIRLREENEYLKAKHLYEKKLEALVQERVRKTKKRRK